MLIDLLVVAGILAIVVGLFLTLATGVALIVSGALLVGVAAALHYAAPS